MSLVTKVRRKKGSRLAPEILRSSKGTVMLDYIQKLVVKKRKSLKNLKTKTMRTRGLDGKISSLCLCYLSCSNFSISSLEPCTSVCGRTHPHPITVFWLQCETCDAWYNVAEECVGFNQAGAEKLDDWHCWSCSPPVAGLEK